jgi:hypothetical protein
MEKRARVTLEESIKERWEPLSMGIVKEAECVLCEEFDECEDGCPIWKKTGEEECHGPPYYEWLRFNSEFGTEHPKTIAAAKEMLSFLKSLLPKKKPRHIWLVEVKIDCDWRPVGSFYITRKYARMSASHFPVNTKTRVAKYVRA